MSGAEYFDDHDAINAYMDDHVPVDVDKAIAEHNSIQAAFREAGIEVIKVDAPIDCQDGVYAANWALISGKKALMANLPNKRRSEEPYAEEILKAQGFEIIKFPRDFAFSGQGDSLPCGKYLFTGTSYRTSPEMHPLLARETGLQVINVQTIPQTDKSGAPVTNKVTGWPDSFFYDIDLAIAVIRAPSNSQCTHDMHTSNGSAFSQRVTEEAVVHYGELSNTEEKRADVEEAPSVSDHVVEQMSRCDCRGLIAWCPKLSCQKAKNELWLYLILKKSR